MNKSFFSYVFRLHRVTLVVISLVGMLGSKDDGIYFLIFLGSIMNIGARCVSYFIDQWIYEEKKDRIAKDVQKDGFL